MTLTIRSFSARCMTASSIQAWSEHPDNADDEERFGSLHDDLPDIGRAGRECGQEGWGPCPRAVADETSTRRDVAVCGPTLAEARTSSLCRFDRHRLSHPSRLTK